MGTHYETLGVTPKATEEEIRKAYRALAFEWHPDRHANSPKASAKLVAINAAYEALTRDRRLYDEFLKSKKVVVCTGDRKEHRKVDSQGKPVPEGRKTVWCGNTSESPFSSVSSLKDALRRQETWASGMSSADDHFGAPRRAVPRSHVEARSRKR